MHIALGYAWYPAALGYHLERALRDLGHQVTYVGLPTATRPGYDSRLPLPEVLAHLPQPADMYLWVDPAAPYFPLDIEASPIPTLAYLVDVHLGQWRLALAGFFDTVFVAQADAVPRYRAALGHDQVHWLPLAAAPDVHRDWGLERIYDVGFVGNLSIAHRRTPRARHLALLQEHFRTNDFYRAYTPEETGRIYSQAKIVPNTNIAGDVTMRLFEAAACGALVLTSPTRNQVETLFVPERELITFRDDQDLLEKTRYYLAHPAERESVARAAQQRVLREHTYHHRAQTLLAHARAMRAPLRTASPAARYAARRAVYTHLHMLDAFFDLARRDRRPRWQKVWHSLPILARRWWV